MSVKLNNPLKLFKRKIKMHCLKYRKKNFSIFLENRINIKVSNAEL